MSLQDLKKQVMQLPPHEQLELMSIMLGALRNTASPENWQFLVARPHPWRKQLAIKGRKLLASTIWHDILTNSMTAEQAADNWALPLAAIQEVIQYCETHQELIQLEADEEKHRLREQGVSFEPHTAA